MVSKSLAGDEESKMVVLLLFFFVSEKGTSRVVWFYFLRYFLISGETLGNPSSFVF